MEVTALRLSARELSVVWKFVCYRGCEPLYQRGGVAYIECATPHECLATKGSIVGSKRRALLITHVINANYGDGPNACLLLFSE